MLIIKKNWCGMCGNALHCLYVFLVLLELLTVEVNFMDPSIHQSSNPQALSMGPTCPGACVLCSAFVSRDAGPFCLLITIGLAAALDRVLFQVSVLFP